MCSSDLGQIGSVTIYDGIYKVDASSITNFDNVIYIQEAIVLGLGTFVGTVINFIVIAFVLFSVIKAMNKATEVAEKLAKKKKEEEAAAAPAEPSAEEKLLTEIRDLLKEQKK